MPFPFNCPHCGHQTTVSEEYAGQSGPCAQCGQTITVPPAPGMPGYGPPPTQAKSNTLVWVLVAVGGLGGLVVVAGILVALLLPAVGAAREAARRMNCANQLKQIGLGLHNYHDEYNCFPPAYVTDEAGTPLYSWRVLILPFIEQEVVYDSYNLDEPWDSPNNFPLSQVSIDVFQCPSDTAISVSGETNYVMIVGPNTISDGPTRTKFRDILDGTSNTLAVVEVTGTGINWAEPRDLDAEQLNYMINTSFGPEIGSQHPGGANVLFCDGSAHFLLDTIDPGMLEDMVTINDGQRIDRNALD